MGAVADTLGGSGGTSFSSDEDPDLVRDALPFGLKLYETLLESTPEHRGLLVATASGFASYAYLLQDEASRTEANDHSRALRQRASRLYLRGRDYALRGLETAHPGFRAAQATDLGAALARTDRNDVDFLYWAAAAQAGALSANKGDVELIADLPRAGAFMQRVLELDEPYGAGAAHEFFVSYEASRPGGSIADARAHYARAQELAQAERASLFVALAENVSVREQNLAEFEFLLGQARAVDIERTPQNRLVNVLAQRRAQWLHEHLAELFLDAEPSGDTP